MNSPTNGIDQDQMPDLKYDLRNLLEGNRLQRREIGRAHLISADLSGTVLIQSGIKGLNSVQSTFSAMRSVECQFIDCDFSFPVFTDCYFKDVVFQDCVFRHATFLRCTFDRCRFRFRHEITPEDHLRFEECLLIEGEGSLKELVEQTGIGFNDCTFSCEGLPVRLESQYQIRPLAQVREVTTSRPSAPQSTSPPSPASEAGKPASPSLATRFDKLELS